MAYGGLWIRKDWLNNLGLKEPTTLGELAGVAKKFTENDPDGNGKKDTYGLGGSGSGAFIDIFGGYGVPYPGNVYVADGKVQNSLYAQGTQDALTYVYQNFVKPKVVDPEIISNTGNQAKDKAFQGKFGILDIDWASMTKDQYAAQIKQINPKAEWEQIAPVKGPKGAYAGPVAVNNGVYVFAVPKSLEKDTKKIDRICQLINYCSDGEGLELVQFGIQGVHYNKDSSGKISATDELAKDGGYFWVYQFAGRPDESYLKVKFAKQAPYIEFANKQPRIITYDPILDLPAGFNSNDAGTYINEQIVKFMYGQQPISDYPKFISTLESQFNYKAYVSSAEKQLKELGLVK